MPDSQEGKYGGREHPHGSLFSDPQEKPLEKFLRVTMTLPGGRTRQLREEAKAEYEQLLADSARMRVLLNTADELKRRLSR